MMEFIIENSYVITFFIFLLLAIVHFFKGNHTTGAVYIGCSILLLMLEQVEKISNYLEVLVQYVN